MSAKTERKIRQIYRKELRGELQHVKIVQRTEVTFLNSHLEYVKTRCPKLMPRFIWNWLAKKFIVSYGANVVAPEHEAGAELSKI